MTPAPASGSLPVVRNLLIFALLYLSGCSVFLSAPEPVDVGFPGRSDTGLLDVGTRDVRPDTMPMDVVIIADAGVSGRDASEAGVVLVDASVERDSGQGGDAAVIVDAMPSQDSSHRADVSQGSDVDVHGDEEIEANFFADCAGCPNWSRRLKELFDFHSVSQ